MTFSLACRKKLPSSLVSGRITGIPEVWRPGIGLRRARRPNFRMADNPGITQRKTGQGAITRAELVSVKDELTAKLYICRVWPMLLRRTPQTVEVLRQFLETTSVWRHGYDLSRSTGLKSGTLYPILIRLTENHLLETRWEASESGRPPRHMYRLTQAGRRFALECVSEERRIAGEEHAFGV